MNARAFMLTILVSAAALMGAETGIYEMGPPVAKSGENLKPHERVDALVLGRLDELGIKPANVCSDAVFVRRAFLTIIGTLPTEQEARGFVAAKQPDKRAQLIEILMQRPEFTDFWAMKFGDLLRVKAEFPIKLWPNAVQAYHRFIHTSVRENKPLHVFARQLLVANGSNFRDGEVNFYRAMQDRSPRGIATTVALTFMGERADKWPKARLDAMAGFFAQVAYKSTSEWKEEIVYFDPTADKEGFTKKAIYPDGRPAAIKNGQEDPRVLFLTGCCVRIIHLFAKAGPTASGAGSWAAASCMSPMTSSRTIRPRIQRCWPFSKKNSPRRNVTCGISSASSSIRRSSSSPASLCRTRRRPWRSSRITRCAVWRPRCSSTR